MGRVEPETTEESEVEREFIRAMVQRAHGSIAANLIGVAILFAGCFIVSFGRALAIALLFRLFTIAVTCLNTRALIAALDRADPLDRYINRFAVGMVLAGMSWGGLLWAIPNDAFATLSASLVRSVVLVGVALVTLTAAPVPRVMMAFLASFVAVAGGCLANSVPELGLLPLATGSVLIFAVTSIGIGLSKEAQRSAAMLIENRQMTATLRALNGELGEALDRADILARFDPLTALANRRSFDEESGRIFANRKADDSWHVLILDLDRFKSINDQAGHVGGDLVLQATGKLLVESTRGLPDGTLAARIGGEEFAILLPGLSSSGARDYAGLLCDRFRHLDPPDGYDSAISVSIGVATWEAGETAQQALRRADDALYEAKRSGRDRALYQPKGEARAA